jgi:hypothetical protein
MIRDPCFHRRRNAQLSMNPAETLPREPLAQRCLRTQVHETSRHGLGTKEGTGHTFVKATESSVVGLELTTMLGDMFRVGRFSSLRFFSRFVCTA